MMSEAVERGKNCDLIDTAQITARRAKETDQQRVGSREEIRRKLFVRIV
jgi:hypothetical protein